MPKLRWILFLGVAALLVADDHARLAVEAGEAADDGLVVRIAAVAVQFAEVAEHAGDVVQSVGPLRMARDLRDLPGGELAVDLLGQLLALLREPRDLVGNVDRRVLVHETQLVDLLLQFGDRLFEVEKGLLHGAVALPGGGTHDSARTSGVVSARERRRRASARWREAARSWR